MLKLVKKKLSKMIWSKKDISVPFKQGLIVPMSNITYCKNKVPLWKNVSLQCNSSKVCLSGYLQWWHGKKLKMATSNLFFIGRTKVLKINFISHITKNNWLICIPTWMWYCTKLYLSQSLLKWMYHEHIFCFLLQFSILIESYNTGANFFFEFDLLVLATPKSKWAQNSR